MTPTTYVSVPNVLKTASDINSYSDAGHELKEAFHAQGMAFLRKLAKALGLPPGTYDVRSNKGGMAVSGEVTLHNDDIYIQLSESCMSRGVSVMYRTCNGRKDYCGHQNHFAKMEAFAGAENQAKMVRQLRSLIEQERQRKASTGQAGTLAFA